MIATDKVATKTARQSTTEKGKVQIKTNAKSKTQGPKTHSMWRLETGINKQEHEQEQTWTEA